VAVLTVGPGQQFTTIESAVAAASPGDTVDVQAGIYTNDFVGIFKNLTLQAVGGPVQMVDTLPADNTPINKAIIDEGGPGISVTINGFDISGAVVPDGNGAAIRYEGGSLTLDNDYIHNNEDGILAASDPSGSITINDSEFSFNGINNTPTDFEGTHNIYVNDIATLTITNSYIHDANVGHEIKSRAENTIITNDRIFDNNSTASYSIDLPNGGNATIQNNVIEQGPNSQNPSIIAYGEEGLGVGYGTSVTIANNVIINDLPQSDSPRLVLNGTGIPLAFQNNQVFDLTPAEVDSGPLVESGTTFLATEPMLNTASTWDIGIDPACFLAGTKICTPTGEVRVEELMVGDIVLTVGDAEGKSSDGALSMPVAGRYSAQPVKWIGRRRIDLATHPRPELVAPVCIEDNAVAENVPHKSLLLSADHAVSIDGKLICAGQLVNGTTIRQKNDLPSIEYFHVELDTHAILLAEGLPVESYLNTGNRSFFVNSDEPLVLHPDMTDQSNYLTREAGSCAPFVWDEASVQPVWQRLADRAAATGRSVLQRATTTDPDLRIRTMHDERASTKPVYRDSNLAVFILQPGANEIRLLSRAQPPTEARPWLNDRRKLGIRLKRMVLRGSSERHEIAMDCPALTEGWWDIEREGQMICRWTNGDGVVPLPALDGHVILEVYLAGEMVYAVETVETEPENQAERFAA
jgi:hypothetical protein